MYKYVENATENYTENSSHGLLAQYIPQGSRVLEFGCGTGVFAKYVAETLGCEVTGVDISEEAIAVASTQLAHAVVADLEAKGWQKKLPYREYDVIVCADVLEHLSSPERLLADAKALLADDGMLVFSLPNIGHADILANLFFGKFNYTDIGLLDRTHIHLFAKHNVVEIFEKAGYALAEIKGTSVLPGLTEQALAFNDDVIKRAIYFSECNNIYQFVGVAYKKEYAKQNGIKFKENLPKKHVSTAKVYFDRGNGLSEADTALFPIEHGKVVLKINIPKGTKQIRIDPTESGTFIATDISFRAGKTELVPHTTFYVENLGDCSIYSEDPQYYITLEDKVKTVTAEFTVLPMLITDGQLKLVKEALAARNSSIDNLRGELDVKERSIHELRESSEALARDGERLKGEISAVSQQLSELNDSYAKSQEELADMVNKNADLERSVASYQKTDAENKEKIRGLTDEKDGLTRDLEKERSNSDQLGKELEKSIQAYNETYQENEENKERIDDLRGEKDDLIRKLEKEQKNAAMLAEELEKYKIHYSAAMDQRNALEAHAENLWAMYQNISTSASWKMTKPLRAVLDLIKKLLRKILPIALMKKTWRCYKENGFKYALQKIKDRFAHRQNFSAAMRPLYTPEELEAQRQYKFSKDIKISILVPLYNTPEQFLHEMIRSVLDQTYSNWELCLADGSDQKHAEVKSICKKYASIDQRIKYRKLEKNLGISENTNACIDLSTGDYIALFDHDDLLHPAALYDVMVEICENGADFVYTDEATFESPNVKKIITVHCKPDFAIDNLRANNYICHLSVFSREVLEKAGKFRHEYDGSQDHDMILRLTENAKKIVHIPKILYLWRSHPMSVAMDINSKTYAIDAGKRAVRDSIRRAGYDAVVESSRAFPTIYRVKYALKSTPLVSIIIPNKNHKDDLQKCIDSILALSTYPNYEIVIVDNGSTNEDLFDYYKQLQKKSNIKVTSLDIPFNYSKLNNHAAELASGEYYILLNNDIEIITPAWIEEMLMYAQRNDVGAVGAMLYYDDNTIQHAGVILRLGAQRIAGHAFNKVPKQDLGYMGRLCYAQNMSAVTAACMMVKASVYREVGGFDEKLLVAYNDIDFCLKIREKGYLIVWTPHAEAYHYESKTRGYEDESPEKRERFMREVALFETKWKDVLSKSDPYYNPNFSLDTSTFDLL